MSNESVRSSSPCWIHLTFYLAVGLSFRIPEFLPLSIKMIIKLYKKMNFGILFLLPLKRGHVFALLSVCLSHKRMNGSHEIWWRDITCDYISVVI